MTALTRAVSLTLESCELTWLPRESIDIQKAIEQHDAYERALAELGLHVISLPAEPDLPDATFVEDPLVVVDEVAIITRMGAVSRRPESESLARAISAFRPVRWLREPATLEGGDVMRIGRDLFVGLSSRTNEAGIGQLSAELEPFGYRVHRSEVPGCLHLKSACCSLGDGKVLANPAWLDLAPLRGFEIVAVANDEPAAANVLRIGDTVLMPSSFPHTEEILRARGFNIKTIDISELIKAEAAVTCSSVISNMSELRRELGLRDISLFAIACIVGTRWVASAAHTGPGSILLWVLAAILLVIPIAIAVASLTEKHPQAGGIYIWTRGDFGPWHGFLAFWTYWVGIAFWFPSAAVFYMSIAASALGPSYEHLAASRTYLVLSSLAAIWIALGTNIVGVRIGKWTENLGAAAAWLLFALLGGVAWLVWKKRGLATPFHLLPDFSWDTISFLSTMAYAMTGFEAIGLMGGEIRNPKRDLKRAAWIASVFTTLFYAGTTIALLVLIRPGDISELNGLAQAGTAAGQLLGARWLPPAIALLVMATAIGQFGGLGSSVSRMPFAAGVDHLMPAAFAKIHPRWATPYVSIIVFGTLASALLILSQVGDTLRGAYQTLVSLMVIAGFFPYFYMFGSSWKAANRVSALSGVGITALAIVCSVVPTAEVHNVWLFEIKLAVGTFAVIASAWFIYQNAQARILK